MTTDDDFDRAANSQESSQDSPRKPTNDAVQKAVQQGAETACNAGQTQNESCRNTKENGRLRELATCQGGGHGTRNSSPTSEETADSETSGADSGALRKRSETQDGFVTQDAIHDPELASLVEAWPTLPTTLRATITALVQSAGSGDE